MWPPEMAEQLRARRYDVAAVAERVDLRTAEDERIFAAAQMEERTIVTEDTGFRTIAIQAAGRGQPHHGLILTNSRRFPRGRPGTLGKVVRALDALLASDLDLSNREYWLS